MLNKQLLIDQLTQLVSFQTVTENSEENTKALNWVESIVNKKAVIKRIKDGKTDILLLSNRDVLNPDIGYLVHMDVVAATDELFKVVIKDNKAYGRGVSDMKFSIPIGLALLEDLIELNSQTSFCMAITTDEEIGGFNGGAYLVDKLAWKPIILIVPDGGDNLAFVDRAKGVAQFLIEAVGNTAHASRPWNGKNAITPIGKLVAELDKIYGKNNLHENWNTTLNFGQINGGVSTNQVCDKATLKIDFRYPETDSIEKIEAQVISMIKNIDGSMKLSRLSTGLPTFTDINLQSVKRFLQCMSEAFGKKIEVKPTYGASDSRFFAKFKTPILMIKPMGGNIHSSDEWLDIDSAITFYKAMKNYITGGKKGGTI